jgi:hypothetical protein
MGLVMKHITDWKAPFMVIVSGCLALGGCTADAEDVTDPEDFAQARQAASTSDPGLTDIAYATDKKVYLVVWDEGTPTKRDIFGALVKANGTVTTGPFAISQASGAQSAPRVASDGTAFFVTWQDGRNAGDDIYGTRVLATGQVAQPSGVVIVQGSAFATAPDVAFSSGHYLTIWSDNRAADFDIYGTRVDPTGTVLDPGGVMISAMAGTEAYPAVEGNGQKFIVGWTSFAPGATSYDIHGRIVKLTPSVSPGALVAIGTSTDHEFKIAFGSDGNHFCAAWQNGPLGAAEINVRPVSETGSVGAVVAIPVPSGYTAIRPSVAFVKNRYVAVWDQHLQSSTQNGRLYGQSLSNCDPVGAPFLVQKLRSQDRGPEVASNASTAMTAWTDDNPSGLDCKVCGDVRNEVGGSVVPEFPIRP